MTRARIALALALLACSGASLRVDEVRYTFGDPGAGWEKPVFDAHGWQTAADPPAFDARWHGATEPAVWVRLTQDLTWQGVNNSFFHVAQDGEVGISVNGQFLASEHKPTPQGKDYAVGQRLEVAGRNVYALHFAAGAGSREVHTEHRIGSWVPADERVVRADPAIREPTRDSEVCLGPDGRCYLAATSGEAGFFGGPRAWMENPGVMLRRSTDLRTWENLGWVWTFDRDGTWARDPGTFHGRPARAVWAPEISHFNGKYWLLYSVNHTTPKHAFGIGLLHADQPEGPWKEISPDRPISEDYDPSFFRDDDGKVYLGRNKSLIARLKDDLSGPAEPFRTVAPTNFPYVGFEEPCLFKYQGRYYFAAAETLLHADGKTSYDCLVASADGVYGPYVPRAVAIRYGGHNGFFVDKEGQLRATVRRLPGADLQITIPHLETNPAGLLRPTLADCLPLGGR